jgi:hypothetical protein
MMRNFRASLVRIGVSAAALGATLAFGSPAAASQTYPGAIQSARNMPCQPQCTICHTDLNGGIGTVTKPFGIAMMQNAGLRSLSPDTIPGALTTLETGTLCTFSPSQPPKMGACDSDGDGVGDVDQLEEGRDPNTGLDLCDTAPRYGCGARVARSDANADWLALLFAAATAAVLARGVRRAPKG